MAGLNGMDVSIRPQKSGRFFTIILVVGCLALAAEVLLLVRKNRSLNDDLALARAALMVSPVEPGDRVDSLLLKSEFGDELSVDFGPGQPQTLLLVFTLSCPACDQAMEVWRDTVPLEDSTQLRVVALLLEDDQRSAAKKKLPFPVFAWAGSEKFYAKISRVPRTLLIGSTGIVERTWTGVFTPEKKLDLQETVESILEGPGF